MLDKRTMKKSDRKQYEKAWYTYYENVRALIMALENLTDREEGEFTIDDINQLSSRIEKLTKTVVRIGESFNS